MAEQRQHVDRWFDDPRLSYLMIVVGGGLVVIDQFWLGVSLVLFGVALSDLPRRFFERMAARTNR